MLSLPNRPFHVTAVTCENPEHLGEPTTFAMATGYRNEMRRRSLPVVCPTCQRLSNQNKTAQRRGRRLKYAPPRR